MCHLCGGAVAWPDYGVSPQPCGGAQGTALETLEVMYSGVLGTWWPHGHDSVARGLNLLICEIEKIKNHTCGWVLIYVPQISKNKGAFKDFAKV